MLRVWVTVSLLLTVVFTGIGLLLSRQWGWSEYASDELYVVYSHTLENYQREYWMVETDGFQPPEQLELPDKAINALECSPDGRSLAFLTDNDWLQVITDAGIKYEMAVGNKLLAGIANNGTAAVFSKTAGIFAAKAQELEPLVYPANISHAHSGAVLASSGLVLWRDMENNHLMMATVNGQIIMSSLTAFSDHWLASEQIFVFLYPRTVSENQMYGEVYLVDSERRNIVRFQNWGSSTLFSPDGRNVVLQQRVGDVSTENEQVFIFNTVTNSYKQLTSDLKFASYPICFLTFRPQMLIADNP